MATLPGSIVVGSVTVSVFCGWGACPPIRLCVRPSVPPATLQAAGGSGAVRSAGEQLQPGASGALAVAGALRGCSSRCAGSRVEPDVLRPVGQLRAELTERLGVDLAHPALGDA